MTESEGECFLYKRNVHNSFNLKLKASRKLYHEINTKYPVFPFSSAQLSDLKAMIGLKECILHGLIEEIRPLESESQVAHLMITFYILDDKIFCLNEMAESAVDVMSSKMKVIEKTSIKVLASELD